MNPITKGLLCVLLLLAVVVALYPWSLTEALCEAGVNPACSWLNRMDYVP